MLTGAHHSGYLSKESSWGEYHNVVDTIRLHKDTLPEEIPKFRDPDACIRAPAMLTLYVAEFEAVCKRCDIIKVSFIDVHAEENLS